MVDFDFLSSGLEPFTGIRRFLLPGQHLGSRRYICLGVGRGSRITFFQLQVFKSYIDGPYRFNLSSVRVELNIQGFVGLDGKPLFLRLLHQCLIHLGHLILLYLRDAHCQLVCLREGIHRPADRDGSIPNPAFQGDFPITCYNQ